VLRQQAGNTFTGDVFLYDESGELVAEAIGLHLTLAGREMLHKQARPFPDEWLYQVRWEPKPLPGDVALPQAGELAEEVAGKRPLSPPTTTWPSTRHFSRISMR
jgi:hypothetical protein